MFLSISIFPRKGRVALFPTTASSASLKCASAAFSTFINGSCLSRTCCLPFCFSGIHSLPSMVKLRASQYTDLFLLGSEGKEGDKGHLAQKHTILCNKNIQTWERRVQSLFCPYGLTLLPHYTGREVDLSMNILY